MKLNDKKENNKLNLNEGYSDEFSFLILTLLVLTPMFILASGCTPKLEKFEREIPSVQNGPKLNDILLKKYPDSKKVSEKIIVVEDLELAVSQIENLYQIKEIVSDEKKSEIFDEVSVVNNEDSKSIEKSSWDVFKIDQIRLTDSVNILENRFSENYLKVPYDLSQSYYADLVYQQIKSDVGQNLKEIDRRIAKDTDLVIKNIRQLAEKNLVFRPDQNLNEKLKITSEFFKILINQIQNLKILEEFKIAFSEELKAESQKLLDQAIELDENLSRSETLNQSLQIIKDFIHQAEFELSTEDQQTLNSGLELAQTIENLSDAPTALQALALVWKLLDTEKRYELIKSANEDLYEFFSEASEEEILCYSQKNCRGLKSKIVLNIGVYPKLQDYGFENIKNIINQKSLEFVKAKVNLVTEQALDTISDTVIQRTLKSVSEKREDLKKFGKNLKSKIATGLQKHIKDIWRVDVFPFAQNSELQWPTLNQQLTYIRNQIWKLKNTTDEKEILKIQVGLVESLVALPLYSKSPEKPGLTLKEELNDLLQAPTPRQYLDSPKSAQREIKLMNQALVLQTLADLLMQTSDWRKSQFEIILEKIKAQDVLPDFQSDQLNRSFFPKTEIAAITISVAAQVLYLLQSEFSPLILIDSNNQLITMEAFNSGTSGPIALATATDFINGNRVNTVRMKDMSALLISITKMIEALDGIENTQSKALRQTTSDGTTMIQQLVQARLSLKRLAVGLANFISHQMRLPSGLVASSLSLYNQVIGNDYPQLIDQCLAIQSLIHTYESTGIQIYLWSALDIYYALNQNMYSEKDGFYRRGRDRKAALTYSTKEIFTIYSALRPIKKYLNLSSQKQFEKIMDPWLNASLIKSTQVK